jgi:hypothetical protein
MLPSIAAGSHSIDAMVWRTRGRAEQCGEDKAKIMLDEANKKRNTQACFEVGYVSSSLPIVAEFSDSTPPRFTNHSRTLS